MKYYKQVTCFTLYVGHCDIADLEKSGNARSSLPGNFVIWRAKIKKYTSEVTQTGGKSALLKVKVAQLVGKYFFQAW